MAKKRKKKSKPAEVAVKQEWVVRYSPSRVAKDVATLPPKAQMKATELIGQLVIYGPVLPGWKNFGKLNRQTGQPKNESRYHCHLLSGRPTYVACWKVTGKTITVEVYYVGTHERAPY